MSDSVVLYTFEVRVAHCCVGISDKIKSHSLILFCVFIVRMSTCDDECARTGMCEGCAEPVCDDCVVKIGCCPGTHIAICGDCFAEQLELPDNLGGYMCVGCGEYKVGCCVDYTTVENPKCARCVDYD